MLILNGDRAQVSGAERRVIDILRTSTLPGIAISGCHAHGGEIDLLIITPTTCFAVEVKGLLAAVGAATLHIPSNGRWHAPEIDGNPVHVRTRDTNPWDQVKDKIFGAKQTLEAAAGPPVYVAGAVLVVPLPNCTVRTMPTAGPPPWSAPVIPVNEPGDVTAWLRRTRTPRGTWTVARVLLALDALGAGPLSAREVATEGFPSTGGALSLPPTGASTPYLRPAFTASAPAGVHAGSRPRPPRPHPRPHGRRKRAPELASGLMTGLMILLGLIVVAMVAAAVVTGLGRAGSSGQSPETSPAPISSELAPPPPPPAPLPPPPEPEPRSSCYPFDSLC